MAVCTPPFNPDYLNVPFPRPPAWTWALIIISIKALVFEVEDITLLAIEYASSAVLALKLLIKIINYRN